MPEMRDVSDERLFATAEDAIFEETQRFTQPWIWLGMVAAVSTVWIAAAQQLLFSKPFGTNPAPDAIVLVIWIVVGVLLPMLFIAMRLHTVVRTDGIYIRYFPFHWRYKCFRFGDIAEVRGRKYQPILEYGGWGIRFGMKGWAYNVRGNEGVQLTMRNGKSVLIGTQRIDEFTAAVETARGSSGNSSATQ